MIWTLDYPLRSERLDLRPHELSDLDDLEVFHGDPVVTRYIPWPTRDREQTRVALAAKLDQTAARAPGDTIVLAIERRDSHTVVGEILLTRRSDDRAEIGYVLAASGQGQGYAREAVSRLLECATEVLGVRTVDAVVDERNEPSIRLLRRCGFEGVPSDEDGVLRFRRETRGVDVLRDAESDGRPLLLDGLDFEMVSSTASNVDQAAPTRFHYRQQGGLIWGDYAGDSVSTGRFVGRAVEDRIEIDFAHELRTGGAVVTGSAVSVAERRGDGLWYLVEDFEKDGLAHRSVCKQIDRTADSTHQHELPSSG